MNPTFSRLAAALADRYRIERELGEGGMATVYLARDMKHDRDVAIKVLKPELAAVLGAERFVQEIATTAHLQHPNILPLFDSGRAVGPPEGEGESAAGAEALGGAESFLYYVMPYVEGESLRTKLDREKQLGVEEAVKLVVEVADALEYAHEQGVVHRDIKPENILLHAGRPMVADFGIALAVSAAAGGRMTETGLSLGTPHYMSPEQATAEKEITGRSDIYSLGSVLYEMLTGDPPHTAPSAQQILVKIIAEEARPLGDVRKSVPPNVAAAVGKALEKLPADRFDSAKAFADALLDPNFTGPRVPAAGVEAAGSRRARFALVGTGAVAVVTTILALWGWLRPAPLAPVTRYPTMLTADGNISGPDLRTLAAISPDGSAIVYQDTLDGQRHLFLKRREDPVAQPLPGTQAAAGPFFSPDGAWIGFFQRGELRKMPTAGGASVMVADSALDLRAVQGAWLGDGTIVYMDAGFKVRRVSASGGTGRVVAQLPPPWILPAYMSPLPRGRGVLLTACTSFCGHSAVYVWDARRDSLRLLVDHAAVALYAPTGHLLYMTRDGTLLAAPWDNDALRITGPAVPILDGLQAPGFLLSRSGTGLYTLGPQVLTQGRVANAKAVWVQMNGQVEPVDSTWRFSTGRDYFWGLALSPDGGRLAITLETDLGRDVWIKDLPAGPPSRLTFYGGDDRGPAWAPDGRTVTFLSDRPTPGDTAPHSGHMSVWSRAADGTGEAKLLWRGTRSVDEAFWTPDHQWLVLQTGPDDPRQWQDILAVRPGKDSVPQALVATKYHEMAPAVSPDSRWLAYLSDENGTGKPELYVRQFPVVGGERWQISSGGASAPVWARHGHELFYWSGDRMMAVTIDPGPPFSVGKSRVLFTRPLGVRPGVAFGGHMDVSPDDRRFIMGWNLFAGEQGRGAKLVVVENFLQELRAKLGK